MGGQAQPERAGRRRAVRGARQDGERGGLEQPQPPIPVRHLRSGYVPFPILQGGPTEFYSGSPSIVYMLLESYSSIFSMTYLKQHIKYFLFRRKIQLDLPVVFFYPLDVLHTEWSNRIETAKCNRLLNLRVKSCLTTLCNPHTCSSNQHSFVNEVDSTKYTITPTDNVPCIHDIMCSLLDTSEAAGGNEKKIFFEYFALCLVHAFMLKYLLRGCDSWSGDLRG